MPLANKGMQMDIREHQKSSLMNLLWSSVFFFLLITACYTKIFKQKMQYLVPSHCGLSLTVLVQKKTQKY